MKYILMSLLVFTGSMAFAQTAKVIKVKGQQAIVNFPAGTKPQVGQAIDLGGGAVSGDEAGVGTGSRNNLLALQGQFSILNSNSNTTTAIELTGRYGWNQEVMEFGPLVTIEYSSAQSVSSRTLLAGGWFDFNFEPNKSGVRSLFGVGAEASFGQESTTVGSVTTSSTLMKFFVGGNMKYFGFADNVAIRGDAGLEYDRTTASSTTTTATGLMTKLGLAFYY